MEKELVPCPTGCGELVEKWEDPKHGQAPCLKCLKNIVCP